MLERFMAMARERGLVIESADADGKLHRVSCEGRPRGDKSGWYVLHRDGAGRYFGALGRWDDGHGAQTFGGEEGRRLTDQERAAVRRAQEVARAERDKEQAEAAKRARERWDRLSPEGASPYLARKRVGAYGARFDGDALVIPLRLASGELVSLQTIAADGEKRFLPGGRTQGAFHLLGEPKAGAALGIAEGYATAATIHEATGRAVAAAMNCGNLAAVGAALRATFPKSPLVFAADNDAKTEGKSGRNPGIEAAREAAKRCKCAWIAPKGLPEGGTDFNDLACAEGIDAVRAQLAPILARAEGGRGTGSGGENRFTANDAGVWYQSPPHGNGDPPAPMWICSPLRVTARTRDGEGSSWGYFLEFEDPEGRAKSWAMPSRMLAGDGNEYRQQLLDLGLRINASPAARSQLTHFLQTRNPADFVQCTERTGWHGGVFVLPDRTIGDGESRVIFQAAGLVANTFRARGTLAEWQTEVARYCVGNSRLLFAVSAALAGPALALGGMESGGFHFKGGSSSGKTTALRVAASAFGGEDFMQRWRATDNALEGLAAQHSDAVLILDEIAQVSPKLVGEAAYLLANGSGKARMHRTGATRPRLAWRLLFLSAGEVGLADHMAEANLKARTGQEIRMPDLPADAGKGLGIFEEIHGADGPATFANGIAARARRYYGTAGPAFIEALAGKRDQAAEVLKSLSREFVERVRPQGAEGQAERVAMRFAQVAAAGELATRWSVTGWPLGAALDAGERCFRDWLAMRGGPGNAEERAMIGQVVEILERDGEAKFTPWERAERGDDHMPDTIARLGFWRYVRPDFVPTESGADLAPAREFYVLPEAFKSLLCKGQDYREVAKALKRKGYLRTDEGRLTYSCRLPQYAEGKTRCYLILPAVFEWDRGD
jgi:putative DNA primase/helicase